MASIQKRTGPIKFAHLAEKSENGSISKLSTKVYTDKNPAKLNDLDTLFEKYNTEAKLKKMYDFICNKYELADAPAVAEAA